MAEQVKQGYLDDLVLTFLHQNNPLEILENAALDTKSKVFLERIGWGQQKDYFEDALAAYLSSELNDSLGTGGFFYVCTPTDSFKYQVNGRNIKYIGIWESSQGSSTFNDSLHDILKNLAQKIPCNEPFSANVMFYDEASKKKFESELKKNIHRLNDSLGRAMGSSSIKPQQLEIPSYGTVTLYAYKFASAQKT